MFSLNSFRNQFRFRIPLVIFRMQQFPKLKLPEGFKQFTIRARNLERFHGNQPPVQKFPVSSMRKYKILETAKRATMETKKCFTQNFPIVWEECFRSETRDIFNIRVIENGNQNAGWRKRKVNINISVYD